MNFKTPSANAAYKEILEETGRIVSDLERKARELDEIEARVHMIIEASKVQLSGLSTAIITATQIDATYTSLMVGAGVALNQH